MRNHILTHSSTPTLHYVLFILLTVFLSACGGGSSSGLGSSDCKFTIASTPQNLTAIEVERIVAQAEQAATVLGTPATIAVSDRVGNILAVYRMAGAGLTINLRSGRLAVPVQGLDGLNNTIGSELGAIAKAVTGAYLSSSGNAFSTRTASFIIQEHFPPTVNNQPGGPLFGVQFSQLPCGDFVNQTNVVDFGPKRSPLGLAGDPGGFPIYKNGVVVGGIGVMADDEYGIDLNPTAGTTGADERIAQSALKGFETPACIRADRITLGGQTPPYSNADSALITVNAITVSNAANFIAVTGYYAGGFALTGRAYGNADSGFTDDASDTLGAGAFIVTDGVTNRFPPTTGASGLTSTEVSQILSSAIGVANQARAQIRRPVGSPAQVTVAVTDLDGTVLGVSRTADAPVFGTDVSVQKARTAAFFSKPNAGANLSALPAITYVDDNLANSGITINFNNYVNASSTTGSTAFTGTNAFSARAIGNISRPFFPDGIDGSPNGPLSKSLSTWSPFSTGLQLDLVYGNLTGSIVAPAPNTNSRCTANNIGINNGIQIFPGAVPIYRGATLIGAIGISGDGVDQDDMVAFLGLARAGNSLGTGIANAPNAIRSSQLAPLGVPLRYVNCPQSPFINSSEQNVCSGI